MPDTRRSFLTGLAGAAGLTVATVATPAVAATASPADGSQPVTTESDVGSYWDIRRRPYTIPGLTAGADNTSAINAAIKNAAAYDQLRLPPGDWTHAGTIEHGTADVTVTGYGARLIGTNPPTAGYHITGARAAVEGVVHKVRNAAARGNGENFADCPFSIDGAADVSLTDVESIGARDAAFFVSGAQRARLRNLVGRDSLADGLHFTSGSRDCWADGVSITNPGDDGVAVVSYTNDAAPCHGIHVSRARVVNGAARGFSVAGGEFVTYAGADVTRCQAAAYYVAHEQGQFNTRAVTTVRILGGVAEDYNWGSVDHGAIGVFNLVSGTVMSDVVLAGLLCGQTRKTSSGAGYAKVGNSNGSGGRLRGVVLQDCELRGGSGAKAVYADGVNNSTVTSGAFTYQGGSGNGVTATSEGYTVSGGSSLLAASDTTTGAPGLTLARVRLGGSWSAT